MCVLFKISMQKLIEGGSRKSSPLEIWVTRWYAKWRTHVVVSGFTRYAVWDSPQVWLQQPVCCLRKGVRRMRLFVYLNIIMVKVGYFFVAYPQLKVLVGVSVTSILRNVKSSNFLCVNADFLKFFF